MGDSNSSGRRRPDPFASQLRAFDARVSDLRGYYDNFDPVEKAQFRDWLKKVQTLNAECSFSAVLRVSVDYEVYDDNGDLVDMKGADFTPTTMLAAIQAWDKGEDFAPPSLLP